VACVIVRNGKRFTIDVPVALRRRIKMACTSRDMEMATWMRNPMEINVARLSRGWKILLSSESPSVCELAYSKLKERHEFEISSLGKMSGDELFSSPGQIHRRRKGHYCPGATTARLRTRRVITLA